MTHSQPDTLALIQTLSNERQRLYSFKWPKRNRPTYLETIKRLDRRIAELWDHHRRELAAERRELERPIKLSPVMDEEAFDDVRVEAAESYQVRDGERWRNVSADELAVALMRYVADIPPEYETPVPPLKAVLARRGLTLEWKRTPGGASYGKLVALPI